MTLTIPQEKIDELIRDVVQNLPEYAISYRCVAYRYEEMLFEFEGIEEDHGAEYKLGMAKFRKGMEILWQKIIAGKLPGLSISASNFLDPCDWDCYDLDALLQCAIEGDVIYG